ncbi:tRNA dimethylallyltransferase [Dyadobacter sp. BE34]|uniref:tRNA dimethylallyltransferase n=1 Tax=Dyadobacter fermentans TaxID=94254 RepID=A0ABU1QZK5_9BACT|nr:MULTISPECIES: tRNA (adenosine(37)-N6)-dimethylallyltransferase MiaA [Dyadobacter]MDR6806543.1 tRNA dimethylallyltransferase [Dyadobacter fermentans]MDR7044284.1 tRNA dimethylallyltransferase [Dyadobacter sp. BE242]MDR7198595.1 tRNA dimethylallyltransferase [Dyadobacter sp. BE34]MDR7216557.1 tRNA dimethylallyltransferase [Dyadobacter sp. BE31]MDR7263917.1 tRNA dimethylallyltransferase [Dyadobacter sp. BE32]
MSPETPLLIILGPTASGKTHLATRVAYEIGGEILSADSRQVYRQMDIGTGKDLDEYVVNGVPVPYHLINIRDAGDKYNVNDFQHDFADSYQQTLANGHIPIVCGGTGFYIYALLKGHANDTVPVNESLRAILESLSNEELLAKFLNSDSRYHALADISTRKRLVRALEIAAYLNEHPETDVDFGAESVTYTALLFGLNPTVETRRERISNRLMTRLKHGLIEEVQNLLNQGIAPDSLIYYGLEYKYVTLYLTGAMTFEEMRTKLETEIHRFAKRQMTFFRKMEKDGLIINWIPDEWPESEKIQFIIARYREFKSGNAGNMSV